jgi:hypothetical protein
MPYVGALLSAGTVSREMLIDPVNESSDPVIKT